MDDLEIPKPILEIEPMVHLNKEDLIESNRPGNAKTPEKCHNMGIFYTKPKIANTQVNKLTKETPIGEISDSRYDFLKKEAAKGEIEQKYADAVLRTHLEQTERLEE
jgi:hypothetical protein